MALRKGTGLAGRRGGRGSFGFLESLRGKLKAFEGEQVVKGAFKAITLWVACYRKIRVWVLR